MRRIGTPLLRATRRHRSRRRFATPASAKSITAAIIIMSAALSSCSLINFDRGGSPSRALPDRAVVHNYGPPLPAGARIEFPGEHPPQAISTNDVEGSFRPLDLTPEERVPEIFSRGRLIVGVDQAQNLQSYRDSVTGELKGYEIDLAKEISRDIFDDPERIEFRFVESANRATSLENQEVDMVIRAMTVTRARQAQVLFSTPYLTTDSRLLVMKNSAITSPDQLPGRTVCVTDGSTGLEKARLHAPESRILKTRSWADCLVALQQHHADAILSDDTILSGIAAQDPYTEIVGQTLATEPYAVAMPLPSENFDSIGLARQVNFTIERIRRDGTWWELYNEWFGPYLATSGPPPLHYREEPSQEEETTEEDTP